MSKKHMMNMILGFDYNVRDVENVVMFYTISYSDTTNIFLFGDNKDL